MLTLTLRRPLLGGGIALTVLTAAWCAACSTPTPVTGDTATRFALQDTAMPMNYPVAIPSNWQAYQNPNTAPSSMPAGWPPSNLGNMPMAWPSGYSPNTGASGPVDPSGVGPSSYTGNDPGSLPSAATSAIPAGVDITGQGPGMIGGLISGDTSNSVISPSAAPVMNMNQSQPWSGGGFGFQNSGGWTQ